MKNILITGGCGFIGSCFAIDQVKKGNLVINIDKLTYAASIDNVKEISDNKSYKFFKLDINQEEEIHNILNEFKIDWLINFAAESHVDNSIANPGDFINTNINGTYSLLQASLRYYKNLNDNNKSVFRFLHVSTDEVFGSLKENDPKFNEETRYDPSSPYSASKAASDHLVRAWNHTYGLPTIITNCSNNYGPRQHKEKLIPKVLNACLTGDQIPVYGNGKNIRDWIYVEDHCLGIELALEKGKVGGTYCFGGENEIRNIEIVNTICEILDELKPREDKKSYKSQISYVEDRFGHDYRYAIDNSNASKNLNFKPSKSFKENLLSTILYSLNVK
jgi:dTDP-glucose 4,6-dehydratase